MQVDELIDAIVSEIEDNPTQFDDLGDVLRQGFNGWSMDDLIDEAQKFDIDTSAYEEVDDE